MYSVMWWGTRCGNRPKLFRGNSSDANEWIGGNYGVSRIGRWCWITYSSNIFGSYRVLFWGQGRLAAEPHTRDLQTWEQHSWTCKGLENTVVVLKSLQLLHMRRYPSPHDCHHVTPIARLLLVQ